MCKNHKNRSKVTKIDFFTKIYSAIVPVCRNVKCSNYFLLAPAASGLTF